jgi:CDP-glucose 4,6-dehydratase
MEQGSSPLENLVSGPEFWRDKRVFVTGHTGFKGAWLCLCLHRLGAKVTGFSLPPPEGPNMFRLLNIGEIVTGGFGDIRDAKALQASMTAANPEIVFHLAAQAIVLDSYQDPIGTYATNVMGLVNLLETARTLPSLKALVNVTSDKCYANREWDWAYREGEMLGGLDPYSNSKACAELVTEAYRHSFFAKGAAIATARAGNVIGGGDWAQHRLLPDIFRAWTQGERVTVRNPKSQRPWQHVLEPLTGYIRLAESLAQGVRENATAWNFGPRDDDAKSVEHVVEELAREWGPGAAWEIAKADSALHEAKLLKVDSSRARNHLGWHSKWKLEETLQKTAEWYRAMKDGKDLLALSLRQIEDHERAK